jgi:hypothetical protein
MAEMETEEGGSSEMLVPSNDIIKHIRIPTWGNKDKVIFHSKITTKL